MRRHLAALAIAGSMGIAAPAHAQIGTVLYQENFDSITLGDSVNERRGPLSFANRTAVATDPTTESRPNAYTHIGPAGWTVDNAFDNFGFTDLTNSLGTDVISTDPVPALLYRIPLTGLIVGNTGVGNAGSAADGVDEWEGWSFADKTFWASVDDQSRSAFTKAQNVVAVADSDEYDDLGAGLGGNYYNTGLTSAQINVASYQNTDLTFSFDSSWRAEGLDDTHVTLGRPDNNQTAIVYAIIDGGAPTPLDIWDSDSGNSDAGDTTPDRPASATFKGDALDESLSYQVSIPAGASTLQFAFGYINAANDWWWAIDNLDVKDSGSATVWSENFDGVTLGPSTNERKDINPTFSKVTAANNDPNTTPFPNAFSHTVPAGWNVDNSGIPAPAIGDNNVGVFEWEGWSVTTRAFSAFASQTSLNSFTKGSGNIVIADSDEFDDFNGATGVTKPITTVLESPTLDITGLAAGSLLLQFDSSWRDESGQTALITVDYGNGEVEVLNWNSTAGDPLFHGTNLDETVLLSLNNPAGATSAKVRFEYTGGNNWFWALDNVQIGTAAIPEPASLALAALSLSAMGLATRRRS
ncbi:PEP-CTERM sorting domain-containing protein [Lacipirellula limnantheis]|nr:PEP-CTERM sorting domain-containing protein [Lacipirellula limnantheis]